MADPYIERMVYKRKRWQRCRSAYFALRLGICERCGEPGEIVHHVEELTVENCTDPNIAYGFDNLELLCWSCHEKTKTKDGIPIRADIAFDLEGNVIPTGKRIPAPRTTIAPPSRPPVSVLGRAEREDAKNTQGAHEPPYP